MLLNQLQHRHKHRSESQVIEELAGGQAFERAVAGQDVWLTIDIKLQEEVRKAFRYYKSGAAIVITPDTGEVLALYSKPGFDSNIWSGRLTKEEWDNTTSNPYTPLINKAVTPYAPGSVYKIVTSAAALTDGIATPETTIDCERRSFRIRWYASSADANTCGSFFEIGLFGKRAMYASS